MPLHPPVYTMSAAHSEPLHSVQRLRESFLTRFVFGQKIEVLFIPLCDTCLCCGQNSQFKLGCSAHSTNTVCQREGNVFQAIPQQQQQQLTPVTPMLCCTLSPLRKPCFSNGMLCCLEDGFHCLCESYFFCQKRKKIGTIRRKTGNSRNVCVSVIMSSFADLIIVSSLVI